MWTISIIIGTPPQPLRLMVDTGSSELYVNTYTTDNCENEGHPCAPFGVFDPDASHTRKIVGHDFLVDLEVQGSMSGDYVTDIVYLAGQRLENLQFGVAIHSYFPFGIFGLSYGTNQGPDNKAHYPTAIDHLFRKQAIKVKAFSFFMDTQSTGRILFGGIDHAKFKGNLVTISIIPVEDGIYKRFQVNLGKIGLARGPKAIPLRSGRGNHPIKAVLDSGTTLTYLPLAIVDDIRFVLQASQTDKDGFPWVDCGIGESGLILHFTFEQVKISIPIAAMLDTHTPPIMVEGVRRCLLGVGPTPVDVSLLGKNFLAATYVVFDLSNNKISLAPIKKGVTQSDIVELPLSGVLGLSHLQSSAFDDLDNSAESFSGDSTSSAYNVDTNPLNLADVFADSDSSASLDVSATTHMDTSGAPGTDTFALALNPVDGSSSGFPSLFTPTDTPASNPSNPENPTVADNPTNPSSSFDMMAFSPQEQGFFGETNNVDHL